MFRRKLSSKGARAKFKRGAKTHKKNYKRPQSRGGIRF